jgi:hypothetical protein
MDRGHRGRPTIARVRRGRTAPERADAYEAYHRGAGIAPLRATALGVQRLRADRAGETELVTICCWESVEAMVAFTGGDPGRVHHLPRGVGRQLELPMAVQIFRLLTSEGDLANAPRGSQGRRPARCPHADAWANRPAPRCSLGRRASRA